MTTINKKEAPSSEEINDFVKNIDFKLPTGFVDFFSKSNGGEIYNENFYIIMWSITDMIKLNKDYNVNEYAPGYFIFGSDGGDMAYCIEKKTGYIGDMPFIGMSDEEFTLRFKSFKELLDE